jgi:hypothetical protein
MRHTLLLFALAACGVDHFRYDNAAVQVVTTGDAMLHATACIGTQLLECDNAPHPVTLFHDGEFTPMEPDGIIFPEFAADASVGDPTKPYLVIVGPAAATMSLPEPFEISGAPADPVTAGDQLHLQWPADDARAPMQWTYSYGCGESFTGEGGQHEAGDTGATISMATIDSEIAKVRPAGVSCVVTIQIDRFEFGDVDPRFPVRDASAIQRREVQVTLSR